MANKKNSILLFAGVLIISAFVVFSCQKNSTSSGSTDKARIQIRLTDKPDPNVAEVWVDIKEIILKMGDSSEIKLANTYPGVYNLLELTNGKDTLLADADVPAGTISQIRLVLGENNYIVTKSGETIDLTTPSAQQSGLKVQLHQDVTGGVLYRLILDFDAAKSIVKAGNSGKYLLKPVLRVISFVPSGGNVMGVVTPDSVTTLVYAINGPDTVASTATDSTGGYYVRDIPAGAYTFSYIPQDTIHRDTTVNVAVTLGQTTVVDTVKLAQK